ncbi:glycoside hydrolase family 3 C-terminal domain-containing protein [Nocardia sp. NPDC004711]
MSDIDALTLEQKASLLSGADMWRTKAVEAAGIESFVLADGPHGVRYQEGVADHLGINNSLPATCYPTAAAVGSSWDPDVAQRIGAAIGRECRAFGITVSLGPGVNIKRSPLCGRNFEYYSEDPVLSGALGAAHVRALQGEGVAASVKHFAANNQETDRMQVSADIDERTLREIYLPAFETIVKQANPATVMCSYNRVNGIHASQHRWLLTDVLREEWGFGGVVVSDWGAVHDRVAALAAGLDLQMPGSTGDDATVAAAVRADELSAEVVDMSVRRLAALAARKQPPTGGFDVDAHHRLARELAAECAVLLKNDGAVLPLTEAVGSIAVVGAFAAQPRFQGGGSSHINPTRVETALEAIQAYAAEHGHAVVHAAGLEEGAVTVAARADVAVVFAGLAEKDESEGFDRASIELPVEQVALIRAVAAVATRTVVVLSHGGVVSMEGWHDDVDAILDGWLLGQAGGGAIADLLFGVTAPSGRLAETIPMRLQDNPSYLNFPGEAGHVRYGEATMVGYRYYETAEVNVRYPFGHGLTYTRFAVSGLEVLSDGDDAATVRATVTNIGDLPGKYVLQVYVATEAGQVRRPVRELRAFRKVALAQGESTTVELTLDRRAFAYYDIVRGDWAISSGEYAIQLCDDASTVIAEHSLVLAGDLLARELSLDSTVGEWFGHPTVGPALVESLGAGLSDEQRQQAEQGMEMLKMVESMPMRQLLDFPGVDIPGETLRSLMELSRSAAPVV